MMAASGPSRSVLGGLRAGPGTSQMAKGLAMQNEAGVGLERAKQGQQLAASQMQADSQDRLNQAQNQAQQAGSDAQSRTQESALHSRAGAFNLGQAYDYAGLQKRKSLQWQQALLGNLMRDS